MRKETPADFSVIVDPYLWKQLMIMRRIYISGDWTNDLLVTRLALPKKNQAKKYSDHRTISLISHTRKVVAHLLRKRLESKMKEIIEEDQFGFWKGKGTRDAIGLKRIITERMLEMCLCFIDWQKAFDHVNCTNLPEILKIPELARSTKSETAPQSRGSPHCGDWKRNQTGCCKSPNSFNLVGELEALTEGGEFKIEGRIVNKIRFANATAIIAKTQEELKNW